MKVWDCPGCGKKSVLLVANEFYQCVYRDKHSHSQKNRFKAYFEKRISYEECLKEIQNEN